jgi:hypothetical protein
MDNYMLTLGVRIKQREDGTFVATGKELPILVVADDMHGLRRKLSNVAESVAGYLEGLGDVEARRFLAERGIAPERVGDDEAGGFSMPVLVGA